MGVQVNTVSVRDLSRRTITYPIDNNEDSSQPDVIIELTTDRPDTYEILDMAQCVYHVVQHDSRYRNRHNRLVLFVLLIHRIRECNPWATLVGDLTYSDVLYDGMSAAVKQAVDILIDDHQLVWAELMSDLDAISGI